jgi:hypothetical protein
LKEKKYLKGNQNKLLLQDKSRPKASEAILASFAL